MIFGVFVGFVACLCGAESDLSDNWVADPMRTRHAEWEVPKFDGRDFWTLLEPVWLELAGVKDEKFVRDSGLMHVKLPLTKENMRIPRVLVLREVEIFQGDSLDNSGKDAIFNFSSKEKGVEFQCSERINDLNTVGRCYVSADPRPVQKRYRPVEARLEITLKNDQPVTKIVIHHGSNRKASLQSADFLFKNGGNWESVKPWKIERNQGSITAMFKNAPASRKLAIDCVSIIPVISIGDFSGELAERCLKYPFYPWPHFYLTGGSILGLSRDNFDPVSWGKFLDKYQKTFMGFDLKEWDSNFFQGMKRKDAATHQDLMAYVSHYDNRRDAEKNLRSIWDYQRNLLFDRVFGLSGQLDFPQYGLEWGGDLACMELAANSANFPHRNNLLFTRGAARQYGKPWMLYLAYYYGACTSNSKAKKVAKKASQWSSGLDFGIAPSLGRRLFYLSYYMGCNFLTFESQPWGQVKQEPDGNCSLTGNGEAIKDIYTWAHSEAGERGSCHTPILFLMDYHHGHAEWSRGKTWKVWYTLPFEDGDYMAEHFLRAVDPFYGAEVGNVPPYSPNLHNGELGDVFDVFFANPPSGVVNQEALDKYPVVVLLDDIRMSTELVKELRRYVRDGGTLIVNSAQCQGAMNNPRFLGVKLLPEYREGDGLRIRKFIPTGAKTLMTSTNGLPILTKNNYGNGHVLLTTPAWMLLKDKKEASPLIKDILTRLQRETLPIHVDGDVEFLFNNMGNGSWKVVLINNKGVLKKPDESQESRDMSYTATVTLRAPARVSAKEVLAKAPLTETVENNQKLISLTVPPGEIRVVDIDDVIIPKRSQSVNLIGCWNFDEEDGTVLKDASRHDHDGVVAGAERQKTPTGSCLKFNGKDSYAQFAFTLKYPLERGTLEVWAKPNFNGVWRNEELTGVRRGEVVNSGSVIMNLDGDRWRAMVYDGINVAKIAGPKAVDGQWTHLAMTWSGFIARFYVNGEEVEGELGPMKYSGEIGNDRIGKGKVGFFVGSQNARQQNILPFNGWIDDLKLFNRDLSAAEIKQHYEKGARE